MQLRYSVLQRKLSTWGLYGLVALWALSFFFRPAWGPSRSVPNRSPKLTDAIRHDGIAMLSRPPLRLAYRHQGVYPVSVEELKAAKSALQLPDNYSPTVGSCIHILKYYGQGAPLQGRHFKNTDQVLEALLKADVGERYFGKSPVIHTRFGARFPTLGNGNPSTGDKLAFEAHRDQCLATLAEIGVPLDREIVLTGNARGTVRDCLRDAVANFYIEQRELEWTSVAFALYLPPHREWINRYNEACTFDMLCTELLNRAPEKGSCYGTHLYYALATILRVDRQKDIISKNIESEITARLQRVLSEAIRQQLGNGAWSNTWDESLRKNQRIHPYTAASFEPSLLATAHVAELLLYFPGDLQAPASVIRSAASFLDERLNEMTPSDRWKGFCPVTHGYTVLRQASYVED